MDGSLVEVVLELYGFISANIDISDSRIRWILIVLLLIAIAYSDDLAKVVNRSKVPDEPEVDLAEDVENFSALLRSHNDAVHDIATRLHMRFDRSEDVVKEHSNLTRDAVSDLKEGVVTKLEFMQLCRTLDAITYKLDVLAQTNQRCVVCPLTESTSAVNPCMPNSCVNTKGDSL